VAADIFLQLDGIKGESTDKDHKDWIEVLSLAQVLENTAPTGGAGAAGSGSSAGKSTGRVEIQEITINKQVDVASPKLYAACLTAQVIKTATVEVIRAAGATRVKYLVIKLEQVIISRAVTSIDSQSPHESVSLNYGKVQWSYSPQKPDGTQAVDVTDGWNLVANKNS
jgi:type VI secretion system secreted protein Hcp